MKTIIFLIVCWFFGTEIIRHENSWQPAATIGNDIWITKDFVFVYE
jgi:hypothetical protein